VEVVGSKMKVGCRQSASMIVRLRFFPALPSPFTFVFTIHSFPLSLQTKMKILSFLHKGRPSASRRSQGLPACGG